MATYDLADWRARLRIALGDGTSPYLWDDDTLDQCTLTAITDHALLLPHLVRRAYSVVLGAQEFALTVTTAGDLLGVVGVELAGVPLPLRDLQSTGPARSAASRAVRADGLPQGYSVRDVTLRLRQPASAAETGTNVLVVWQVETYALPDSGTVWTGPVSDVPLVLLLARRAAYQILAEWQARTQGLTTPTIASGSTNVHLDIPPILAALEVEIQRALDLRKARVGTVPPLPVGR